MKFSKTVRIPIIFVMLAIILSSIGEIQATSDSSESAIIKPIEDGYVDSLQPMINFAGSNLNVEYFNIKPQNRQRWSFVLFNLSSIPDYAVVQNAEFYVYASDIRGSIHVGVFKGFDTDWNEEELYWTDSRTQHSSCSSPVTTQIDSIGWHKFDVKEYVQESLQKRKLSLVIRPYYSEGFEYASSAVFYSCDQPGRFKAPRLEITYLLEAVKKEKDYASIQLGSVPLQIEQGDYLTISGVLQSGKTLLKEKKIMIEYSLNNSEWEQISEVETDPDGSFSFFWNPERIGSSKLKARFEGDDKYEETESVTQFLVESKIPQEQTSNSDSNLDFLWGVLGTTAGIIIIIPLAIWFRKHDLSSIPILQSFNNRNGVSQTANLATQEMMQTISTGYEHLDGLLNGGLKRNYIVALTTPSCDETDLLIHRFLNNSLKSQNSTLYMTTKINGERELLEKYPESFFYIICNPQMDEDKQDTQKVYRVRGTDNLTEINLKTANVLQKMNETKKEKVVCIDIISDVLLQHGLVTTRKWLIDFIARMRSNSMTTIMILNSQMHSKEDLESILGLFDGQIDVWEQGIREIARKQLKVKRMYRHIYDDQSIPLEKSELY